MRILLVEDDAMIGAAVRDGLRQDGFAVDWVRDGAQAEAALANRVYETILLDLGLPRRDGLALLRAMRGRGDATPVLILTARDSVADRVAGLDAGADDYLVKPFDFEELGARIRALRRRLARRASPVVEIGDLKLDPATREVAWKGRGVALSGREYALLAALSDRPGAILSRAQLEDRVYGWNEEVGSNAIEVHIHALRRKLDPRFIRNVRGVGYTLAPRAA
jgi:two-component system response regulator QseB